MLKHIDKWIGSYLKQELTRLFHRNKNVKPVHIMFSCVDHYEPDWNKADAPTQINRVKRWVNEYPRLAQKHKDADGCHPKHTFFYPAECYVKEHFDLLDQICRQGLGEVEIHLHHDGDTEKSLTEKLIKAKNDFTSHGFLGRRQLLKQIRFAFIHGNWCLNNSRADKRFCGVNDETRILSEQGCYADFTFPSAPSETQTNTINSLYYVKSNKTKVKTHDRGIPARVGQPSNGDLLLVQGPLTLNWRQRKNGIFPRIENGEISPANPPTPTRVDLWIEQRISVEDKPDWIFVKVHTHGAPEKNANTLLGEPMDRMFTYLETQYNDGTNYVLHYVSAREMYNIIKAAEAGEAGAPGQYRNFIIERNQNHG